MPETALPVTGYLDRFSFRPGERFTAFVSLRHAGPFRAKLVRVVSADPNPAGPGLQMVDLGERFDAAFEGVSQPIVLGSCAVVDKGPGGGASGSRTWTALVCPGITDRVQAVLAEGGMLSLGIGPNGASGRVGSTEVSAGAAMRVGCWYRIWMSVDGTSGNVIVGQQCLDAAEAVVVRAQLAGASLPSHCPVTIGAADGHAAVHSHFTGKIEAPAILDGFAPGWSDPLTVPALPQLAAWDLAREMSSQSIIDTGPSGCHGRLLNLPTRAVTGARWSGAAQSWQHAPADYAAIHFHADDLGDCGWEPSFEWSVPDDMPSGAYALHLTCEDGEDWIPLYVLPKRTGPFAPIAFLASTFTYLAYANHARGTTDDSYFARVAVWGGYLYNPDQWPLYGRSTYNVHLDGSGISFSSRRRPILTMRPGYLTFNDPFGSGLRHYQADSHLLAWLEAKGIAFDVITDEDLDNEGAALLRPYRAVLTGSHPEYHTTGTLDALWEYTRSGGRMAYLGGNGFYWRVARDKAALPWATELRRAEGGIRTWAAEPGEYYHQLDGAYGGLWRRNRRPPQLLCGVGFSGQGAFEGTHYRLLPAARDPKFAWMFDGIEGDILGEYGLSGGGAAGFELDRADDALGTPDGAVILARSEDPPASFFTVPEEVLAGRRTVTGERLEDLMRAEIVYFDLPGGGSVFSVGSITFCGSLWRNGWEGPVSQLLENVVRRFGGG